jgi:hypothetical protein
MLKYLIVSLTRSSYKCNIILIYSFDDGPKSILKDEKDEFLMGS